MNRMSSSDPDSSSLPTLSIKTPVILAAFTMHLTKTVVGLAALAGFAAAHPGHDVAHEAAERRAYMQTAKRTSLSHCADKLKARGIEARNVARREAVVQKARQKRALKKRDFASDLSTSHNKTSAGYTANTDASTLFAGYNSCLLTPEVTQGPYCKFLSSFRR